MNQKVLANNVDIIMALREAEELANKKNRGRAGEQQMTYSGTRADGYKTNASRCGTKTALGWNSFNCYGCAAPVHMSAYRQANMLRTMPDIWENSNDLNNAFAAWEANARLNNPTGYD